MGSAVRVRGIVEELSALLQAPVVNHGIVVLRTSATMRQGRTDELPFQEHGTGRSLYPADKVSIAEPSRSVGR